MNQIRAEFEAKFPMPEKAVYVDSNEYVWVSHPIACHPYDQLYEVWCEAHATYAGTSAESGVINDSKKWRVDDVVADQSGHLYQIQGVRGNEFLVSLTSDITTALSFVSVDKLRWHSRVSVT